MPRRSDPTGSTERTRGLRSHGSRFVKFGLVGVLGIGVNMLAYALYHEAAGIADFLARGLAIETAVLHNFGWNFFWTWRDRGNSLQVFFARMLRYHGSTAIASFVIPLAVGWFADRALGEIPYANYISHLAGIGSGMVINYLLSDLWVFRVGQKPEQDKRENTA